MRLIDIDVLGVGRCNPDVFKVPDRAEGWNDLLDIINSAPHHRRCRSGQVQGL